MNTLKVGDKVLRTAACMQKVKCPQYEVPRTILSINKMQVARLNEGAPIHVGWLTLAHSARVSEVAKFKLGDSVLLKKGTSKSACAGFTVPSAIVAIMIKSGVALLANGKKVKIKYLVHADYLGDPVTTQLGGFHVGDLVLRSRGSKQKQFATALRVLEVRGSLLKLEGGREFNADSLVLASDLVFAFPTHDRMSWLNALLKNLQENKAFVVIGPEGSYDYYSAVDLDSRGWWWYDDAQPLNKGDFEYLKSKEGLVCKTGLIKLRDQPTKLVYALVSESNQVLFQEPLEEVVENVAPITFKDLGLLQVFRLYADGIAHVKTGNSTAIKGIGLSSANDIENLYLVGDKEKVGTDAKVRIKQNTSVFPVYSKA